MKKKIIIFCSLLSLTVAAVSAAAISASHNSLPTINAEHETHVGNHYLATSESKEYWVCCECHEHFLGEVEVGSGPVLTIGNVGYQTAGLFQFEPIYDLESNNVTSYKFYSNHTISLTPNNRNTWTINFDRNLENGETLIIYKGSYVVVDDTILTLDKTYFLSRTSNAYKASYNDLAYVETPAGDWVDAGYADTTSFAENDDRLINATPFKLTRRWGSGANMQYNSDIELEKGLTIITPEKVKTSNGKHIHQVMRVWETTIVGFDSLALEEGDFLTLEKGMLVKSATGKTYVLSQDVSVIHRGSEYKDLSYDYFVESLSDPIIAGSSLDLYFNPNGTDLPSFTPDDGQCGGLVPDQTSYEGSIKYCGVEATDLYSSEAFAGLKLFISSANWDNATMVMNVRDSAAGWDRINYPDFGTNGYEYPTIEIAASTIIKIIFGNKKYSYYLAKGITYEFDTTWSTK